MSQNKGKVFFTFFFLFVIFMIVFLNVLAGPLIFSFILAYLLNPIFELLEKKGAQRFYSAIFFVTFISVAFSFLAWTLFPILLEQINSLLTLTPEFKNYLEHNVLSRVFGVLSQFTGQTYDLKPLHVYDVFSIDVKKVGESLFSSLGAGTKYVAIKMIMIVITPFFMFFLMRDLPKIYKLIFSLVPNQIRPVFSEFATEVDVKLTRVLRGQFLVIFILCLLYPTALLIAGLPAAIAVGVMIGLARFVPYMDTIVGISLCFFVLVTRSASNELIIAVSIAFLSVQFLDGLFITPRIMGKFSGLHPFFVILSVICFGNWFGFWGVLLAIPTAAILKVALTMMINTYRESDYFKDGCSE